MTYTPVHNQEALSINHVRNHVYWVDICVGKLERLFGTWCMYAAQQERKIWPQLWSICVYPVHKSNIWSQWGSDYVCMLCTKVRHDQSSGASVLITFPRTSMVHLSCTCHKDMYSHSMSKASTLGSARPHLAVRSGRCFMVECPCAIRTSI